MLNVIWDTTFEYLTKVLTKDNNNISLLKACQHFNEKVVRKKGQVLYLHTERISDKKHLAAICDLKDCRN